jgi:hypothetical protein
LHHRKPGTRASGAAALEEAVNEEAVLADAGKSNRKYDGAYFLLSRAGWASLDNLWPSRPATQGEFAGHTAAVMIAIGTAGATVPGLFLRQVGTAFLQ